MKVFKNYRIEFDDRYNFSIYTLGILIQIFNKMKFQLIAILSLSYDLK